MSSMESVTILEGSTFVVSDRAGDLEGSGSNTHGLFHQDMRYLSRWILTVNGIRPSVLSTDSLRYFATQFFLAPATGTIYVNSSLSLIRQRAVGSGFHEDLTIFNHSSDPAEVTIRIDVGSDFA